MTETLASIGEFGLIDRIDALIRKEGLQAPGIMLGIGDDCASFRPREGYESLVTCDSMVEGRHFLPRYITPLELGRRAMVMNISDIGAMGGSPLYALVSLGLRGDTPVKEIEEIYRGFLLELNPLGASIIGGNLTQSGNGIFIDITLIGDVEQGKILGRSTAGVDDAILVTGFPGQSAAGLQLLLNADGSNDLQNHPLVRAYNAPSHRALEGRAIARSGSATAMIDISDGLLGDLGHICEESGVGAELYRERLPLSDALKGEGGPMGIDPVEWVLKESDDYELIVTCRPDRVDMIRSAVAQVSPVRITEIGQIKDRDTGMSLILPDGSKRDLSPAGWDHFAESE